MTYFRVQLADRDVNELLDEGYQFSYCYGTGRSTAGVSTCESLEDLCLYLASPMSDAIDFRNGDWVLVEVEADEIPGSRPVDELEVLVRPTAIVAVTALDGDFFALVDAAAAELESYAYDPSADFED